ncbi:hypothetical protein BaRGS_00034826 [Batillaria attramentaria]|uniref:Uncharacterized protein n=1 Tax=Batillaria attramentaria TaxID=370345 RepID=A0ABD0JG66_9CAEN
MNSAPVLVSNILTGVFPKGNGIFFSVPRANPAGEIRAQKGQTGCWEKKEGAVCGEIGAADLAAGQDLTHGGAADHPRQRLQGQGREAYDSPVTESDLP